MLFFYRFLINLITLLSPIIFIYRILKNKEDLKRFKEKIGFFDKKKKIGKLIWFHGASVGEIKSIIPLLEKYEKNPKVKQILITSNTLSSAKIIKDLKIKKIIHQFFPIDCNYFIKKFINYWQPSKALFIDSEIWPNTILRLKNLGIPIILINARITKKTFKRWKFFSSFSKNIFSKIDICLASSQESYNYLNKLGVKNIKIFGNLKFSQTQSNRVMINKKFEKIFRNKNIWCASSTHENEEITCGLVHLKLKKTIQNLLTIIIPRHINRCSEIKKKLEDLNLVVHTTNVDKKIPKNIDILLVNSYGKTKPFFEKSRHVFLGGSLIMHGGQNPIEPAVLGCNILHGPYIQNFKEIYKFLEKNKISKKINNVIQFMTVLKKKFKQKKNNQIKDKLKIIGNKILEKTYNEINLY